MAIRLSDQIRNIIVDKVTSYLSGTAGTPGGTAGSQGMLRIFGGTQPATGGGTSGTQGTLCQIDGLSWTAGTGGTAAIVANKSGTAGSAGTATWARLSGTDGTGYIIDGGVGTAATSDFVIDSALIANGAVVTVTSASIIMPGS